MTSSPNPPASSSAWNRNAALILGITLINLLGIPMITPALPAMREAVGVTDEQLGLVMTAYALPALIIVPFVGLLADRYGKKLVLIPSLFLFSIAGSAVGWAENLETLLTLRLVQGLGASGLSNLSVALIGDYFSGHDRARVMGRMGAAQIIAAGGYPLLGGFLVAFGWHYPFLTCLLGLPVGLLAMAFMTETKTTRTTKGREFLGHAGRSLADRRVVEILIMTAGFIFVGFGALNTYLPVLLADKFGTSAVFIGVIISARSFSGTIAALQLARLAQIFSYRGLITAAFLVQAAAVAMVPLLPTDMSIMIAMLAYGAAFGVVRPGLQVMIIENAPEDLRATFASGVSFALRLAQTLGPVASGAVIAFGSFDLMYYGGAAIAVALSVLAFTAKALKPAT